MVCGALYSSGTQNYVVASYLGVALLYCNCFISAWSVAIIKGALYGKCLKASNTYCVTKYFFWIIKRGRNLKEYGGIFYGIGKVVYPILHCGTAFSFLL